MTVPKGRQYDSSLLEGLRHAVHGLCVPFACGGTLVPDEPLTLCFKDQTRLPVLRAPRAFEQEQLLQPLVKRCTPAPFGKGRQTRYDRSVRNALQLKAEGGAFSVLHFDPQAAGILEQIRRALVPQDLTPSPQRCTASTSTRGTAISYPTRTPHAAATCSAPSSSACPRSSPTALWWSSIRASSRPSAGGKPSDSRLSRHASTGPPSSGTSIIRSSGSGEASA